MPNLTDIVLQEVKDERSRQNEKWGIQRHTPEKWLAITLEEIGELAQAMQKGSVAHKPTDADSMINEAIQASAVLVSFCEQLLEEMAMFEPCPACTEIEYCGAAGRLCEGTFTGDIDGQTTEKI